MQNLALVFAAVVSVWCGLCVCVCMAVSGLLPVTPALVVFMGRSTSQDLADIQAAADLLASSHIAEPAAAGPSGRQQQQQVKLALSAWAAVGRMLSPAQALHSPLCYFHMITSNCWSLPAVMMVNTESITLRVPCSLRLLLLWHGCACLASCVCIEPIDWRWP